MAGFQLASPATQVTGISVLYNRSKLSAIVSALEREVAGTLGADYQCAVPDIDDRFVGAGYGIMYPEMVSTIEHVARHSGVLFDPVYTGKAIHGLLRRLANGEHEGERVIVFVHTGGMPGLFAYTDSLDGHFPRTDRAALTA